MAEKFFSSSHDGVDCQVYSFTTRRIFWPTITMARASLINNIKYHLAAFGISPSMFQPHTFTSRLVKLTLRGPLCKPMDANPSIKAETCCMNCGAFSLGTKLTVGACLSNRCCFIEDIARQERITTNEPAGRGWGGHWWVGGIKCRR